MKTFISFVSILLLATFSFSEEKSVDDSIEQLFTTEERLENLDIDISLLKYEIEYVRDQIRKSEEKLIEDISELKWRVLQDSVILNFKEKGGFARINTEEGQFFICCVGADPYLDGYKISFKIGNPYFCDFNNIQFIVHWRMSYSKSKEKGMTGSQWVASIKEKEFPVIASGIKAGKWNLMELILTPCSVDELEKVELKFTINSVSFY